MANLKRLIVAVVIYVLAFVSMLFWSSPSGSVSANESQAFGYWITGLMFAGGVAAIPAILFYFVYPKK